MQVYGLSIVGIYLVTAAPKLCSGRPGCLGFVDRPEPSSDGRPNCSDFEDTSEPSGSGFLIC